MLTAFGLVSARVLKIASRPSMPTFFVFKRPRCKPDNWTCSLRVMSLIGTMPTRKVILEQPSIPVSIHFR